jgi:hypothetical protein
VRCPAKIVLRLSKGLYGRIVWKVEGNAQGRAFGLFSYGSKGIMGFDFLEP